MEQISEAEMALLLGVAAMLIVINERVTETLGPYVHGWRMLLAGWLGAIFWTHVAWALGVVLPVFSILQVFPWYLVGLFAIIAVGPGSKYFHDIMGRRFPNWKAKPEVNIPSTNPDYTGEVIAQLRPQWDAQAEMAKVAKDYQAGLIGLDEAERLAGAIFTRHDRGGV